MGVLFFDSLFVAKSCKDMTRGGGGTLTSECHVLDIISDNCSLDGGQTQCARNCPEMEMLSIV